jgi:predicted glycosyltransferase
VIQVTRSMPRRTPRPYLSFPRGTRLSSPRILLYSSDLPELASRDLALAHALLAELEGASLVLVTGSDNLTRFPVGAGLDIVKLPGLEHDAARRPLERERIRRLRKKLLHTLFDVFIPDLVVLDMVGPEAETEARELLVRAKLLKAATLVGVCHDRPGEACGPDGTVHACEHCRNKTVDGARRALEERASNGRG